MIKYHFKGFLFCILPIFFLAGCAGVVNSGSDGSSGSGENNQITDLTADNSYSGGGSIEVFHVDSQGASTLHYQLNNLNDNTVHFIFTNTSRSSRSNSNPSVVTNSTIYSAAPDLNMVSVQPDPDNRAVDSEYPGIETRSGKPEIDEINANTYLGPPGGDSDLKVSKSVSFAAASDVADVSTADFITYDTIFNVSDYRSVPATCRGVVTDGTVTLNIWVADDCWENGGTKTKNVTSAMVAKVGELFLKNGQGNDIYDWNTAIFGTPWGNHGWSSYLIPATNEITILLYDIDSDNSLNGGCLGYFITKDNFLASRNSNSNERIMFYLDALMLANDNGIDDAGNDGDRWEYTDYWPAIQISTIGHEFQHLIHYYQKAVLRNSGQNSEIWINELCSLMAEDILSEKLGVEGPRGVDSNIAGPGTFPISTGRLPLFNRSLRNSTYYASLTSWNYYSYSITYSFGAYLLRNFGGADFAGNIVQNGSTSSAAIDSALSASGSGLTFSTALKKWGTAVLLSNRTSGLPDYTSYNNGGGSWFSSTVGNVTYNLGSINMYNYSTAPYIYSSDSIGTGNGIEPSSNVIAKIGDNLSGDQQWDISLASGVALTVVVTP